MSLGRMNDLNKIKLAKESHHKKDGSLHQGYMNIFDFNSARKFIASLQKAPVHHKLQVYDTILTREEYSPKKSIFEPDKKVIGDDTYKVAVLSCDTSIGCINRNTKCMLNNKCYADEVRPSNLKYSMARAIYFNKHNVEEISKDIKEYGADIVRLNEAGDFTTSEQVEKVISLAKKMPKTLFYGYTKSEFAKIRFEEVFNEIENLIIHDSLGTSKILPHFICITNEKELPKTYHLCKGECKICKCCYNKTINKGCIEH